MVSTPILWVCGFVAAAVFAVMIHSVATFRRASGGHPSALVEILWAIVPIFIMVTWVEYQLPLEPDTWQLRHASLLGTLFQLSPWGVPGFAPSWHLAQFLRGCGKPTSE